MSETEPTDDDRIPTIAREKEPEHVGVHSAIVSETCQNYYGERQSDVQQCGEPATHTVVMWSGSRLAQVAMCDQCGDPESAPDDREWSGEVVDV
jgi:hypothetical protein